jgi:hypothetical protein
MKRNRKKFCIHGHEIVIVGRDKRGHCKGCRKQHYKNNRVKILKQKKIYNKNNNEKMKQRRKEWYEKNKEKIKQRRQEQAEKLNEQSRTYHHKHRTNILRRKRKYNKEHRKENSAYTARKRKLDINFKLASNLRSRMRTAIKNNQKAGSAVRDLGCSIEFLKQYITAKFYDGMTWNNWGMVWELDHIIPLFKFDLTNREEFLEACHYTNLQPLTIQDHDRKTAKEAREFSRRQK